MKTRSLFFKKPYATELRQQSMRELTDNELFVATRFSAISAGTEKLIFKGLFPDDLPLDESLASLGGDFKYPLKYGYCCVGEVIGAGAEVNPHWLGRQVFVFHPHESHFVCNEEDLLPIPDGILLKDALFLASMETAVNLVMDGRPLMGEQVLVWGLGVIGLLTTFILSQHPVAALLGVDRLPMRRQMATKWGADHALAGNEADFASQLASALSHTPKDRRADLLFELSGDPESLNSLLPWAGYHGRIVIGSWYGNQNAAIKLGGRFHRDRIRIISSQVSSIDPAMTGRWTKGRRLAVAWQMIQRCQPSQLITHRFPIEDAQKAYELIADHPQDALQVILSYSNT
jgi:2-desacetyl-2-hydroxyethyl bacteriochlorophyllide A dehydrogenase